MNHLRTILAALLFAAAPAAAQTIKTLGYNTTNGNVVAATNLTFTNSLNFATNARAATRTNLGGTTVGNAVFTATNAAAAANAIGLGATNNVTYNTVTLLGNGDEVQLTGSHIDSLGYGTLLSFEERRFAQSGTNIFSWDGGFTVTPAATFNTNVTVNGTLTVKSLTTTDPVGWALDAVQTAAATNGVLTLPDAANVLRITNANAISSVTNGRLGAFYYLVNQTTNNLTISNAGGITVQGGTPLTLGANQAATLVATGPTNASVAARGNLNDVTLGGTANTAPNQTASSGSSLMTRDLGDARYMGLKSHQVNFALMVPRSLSGATSTSGRGSWQLFTATNISSYAGIVGEWAFMLGIPNSVRTVNFSNSFIIAFNRVNQNELLPRAGLNQYVQLGREFGTTTNGAKLNAKGVGVAFSSEGVTPFVHNGTSATDGATATNITNYNRFLLRWLPATAFEVYGVQNGSEPVLLSSVTNNLPTGLGVAGATLEFLSADSGSGGGVNWLQINSAYIITP